MLVYNSEIAFETRLGPITDTKSNLLLKYRGDVLLRAFKIILYTFIYIDFINYYLFSSENVKEISRLCDLRRSCSISPALLHGSEEKMIFPYGQAKNETTEEKN